MKNFQKQFLSTFSIIVLSVYLREYRSPQSKPVDARHEQPAAQNISDRVIKNKNVFEVFVSKTGTKIYEIF